MSRENRDEAMDRMAPHSMEAERGVLGCMFLDPEVRIPETIERIRGRKEVFYDLRHQELFEAMLYLSDQSTAIDLLTLRAHLNDTNRLDAVGGMPFLMELQEATPSPVNLPYYLDIVMEKYRLRLVVQAASAAVEKIYDPEQQAEPEKLLSELEEAIGTTAARLDDGGEKSIREYVIAATYRLEEIVKNEEAIYGVRTGFSLIDQMTTGFHAPDFAVIAARPGCGKTAMCLNCIEYQAIVMQLPVGLITMEMTGEQVALRMLASQARFNPRMRREISAQMKNITTATARVAKAPVYVDERPALDIKEIRAKARLWKQKYDIKILWIDYLQLAKSETKRGEGRTQEISQISNGMKALAKELGIPVVALAQLNREFEKNKGRPPQLSDLRESGSIEQDADTVAFIYKKQSEENDRRRAVDPLETSVLIAKQRFGAAGEAIDMIFHPTQTRFEEPMRKAPDPDYHEEESRNDGIN